MIVSAKENFELTIRKSIFSAKSASICILFSDLGFRKKRLFRIYTSGQTCKIPLHPSTPKQTVNCLYTTIYISIQINVKILYTSSFYQRSLLVKYLGGNQV